MGRKKNNITVIGDAEIYECRVAELTDLFIESELDGDTDSIAKHFPQLLYYLHDNMIIPTNDEIEALDKLFDDYVRLCAKYAVIPTIEGFSILTGIHRSTLYDWKNGEYRRVTPRYADTTKKWIAVCKEHMVHALANDERTSVNKIFLAKAVYGMQESSIVQIEEVNRREKTILDIPLFDDSEEG